MTYNQLALINLLASGTHELVSCSNGFAVWDKNIKWSQGRTPSNAVSADDIAALHDGGYLKDAPHGWLEPTLKCFEAPKSEGDWQPANEGYTGQALMP